MEDKKYIIVKISNNTDSKEIDKISEFLKEANYKALLILTEEEEIEFIKL